jgi:hypothetical protein
VAVLAALLLLLTACGGARGEVRSHPPGLVVGDDAGIYRGQGLFNGERVAVAGTVGEVVDDRSFWLVREPGSHERLLVVHDAALELPEGRAVEIIGRVESRDTLDGFVLIVDELQGFSPTVDFRDEESLQVEQIVATGTVAEVLTTDAVVLEGGLNTEQPVLVISTEQIDVAQGDQVRVVATAAEFELNDLPEGVPTEPFEPWNGLHYLRAR